MWLASHPPQSSLQLGRNAAVMSAIAAIVDYGITPRQLTPGWELTLTRKSMVGAFAGLALGLTAGALLSRRMRGNSIYITSDGEHATLINEERLISSAE